MISHRIEFCEDVGFFCEIELPYRINKKDVIEWSLMELGVKIRDNRCDIQHYVGEQFYVEFIILSKNHIEVYLKYEQWHKRAIDFEK